VLNLTRGRGRGALAPLGSPAPESPAPESLPPLGACRARGPRSALPAGGLQASAGRALL